jgi:dTDP-6-deoxy-L-talose 4-dehydrogenase (NAD+)
MGFIGRHLCESLSDGLHDVCIVVRDQVPENLINTGFSVICGDLLDDNVREKIKSFGPETVYHLAWNGIPDYGLKISVDNLKLHVDLLTFFGEIHVSRVIATGSCWEYGRTSGELKEDMALEPNNAFTSAKSSVLSMGQVIGKQFDFSFIWARLFYVYGPGQSAHSLLPSLINMGLADEMPKARSPWARNDFIYVKDVAHVLKSMNDESFESGVYNVGSGYATLVNNIERVIAAKLGYKSDSNDLPVDGSDEGAPNFWANTEKLQSKIDFKPISIEQGLEQTINEILGDQRPL